MWSLRTLTIFKVTVSQNFWLLIFFMGQFPPAQLGPLRIFSKIRGDIRKSRYTTSINQNLPPVSTTPAANFANSSASVVDTGGKIWKTISGCRLLKVNLKAKTYIYVISLTQMCPNKIILIFLIEDFFHLPPVSTTLVVHLEPQISPRIFEKIQNGRNGILRCLRETDSWKKNKSRKSRGTVPLNGIV